MTRRYPGGVYQWSPRFHETNRPNEIWKDATS